MRTSTVKSRFDYTCMIDLSGMIEEDCKKARRQKGGELIR
jgi:hypothetical protein